jgi:CheY-like chemotaxis protein
MAGRATVLVIDDDPDFLEFTRIVLESQDYEVLTAENAAEGLVVMREAGPDVVLLDVVISYAFNGLNVTREMQEDPQLRRIPLILVSAIVRDEELELFPASEGLHPHVFMSKPIEPAELLQRVKEFTGHPGEPP